MQKQLESHLFTGQANQGRAGTALRIVGVGRLSQQQRVQGRQRVRIARPQREQDLVAPQVWLRELHVPSCSLRRLAGARSIAAARPPDALHREQGFGSRQKERARRHGAASKIVADRLRVLNRLIEEQVFDGPAGRDDSPLGHQSG